MKILNLGLMPYADALKYMEELHTEVSNTEKHQGYILVVEHPPTVTMGNRENPQDMLLSPEALRLKGIDYFKIDRGGSVTVHEPGQCVIYPIFNIFEHGFTVKSYVCALEEAIIRTCKKYGIIGTRDPENPGIWVLNDKIGAVGIRVLNKVTKHGISFNITNSLRTFATIVPCGLHTKGVTSVDNIVHRRDPNSPETVFEDVKNVLVQNVEELLKQRSVSL